jgi:hypothetical protein
VGLENVELAVVGVLVPRTALGNRRNVADADVIAYCRHTKSNERYETLRSFNDIDQKYSQIIEK